MNDKKVTRSSSNEERMLSLLERVDEHMQHNNDSLKQIYNAIGKTQKSIEGLHGSIDLIVQSFDNVESQSVTKLRDWGLTKDTFVQMKTFFNDFKDIYGDIADAASASDVKAIVQEALMELRPSMNTSIACELDAPTGNYLDRPTPSRSCSSTQTDKELLHDTVNLEDSIIFTSASIEVQTDDWRSVSGKNKKSVGGNKVTEPKKLNKPNKPNTNAFKPSFAAVLTSGSAVASTSAKNVPPVKPTRDNTVRKTGNDVEKSNVAGVKWIHVSNVSPETTVASLSTFMANTFGINDSKCHSLLKKSRMHESHVSVSFKIGLSALKFDDVLKSALWPKPVKVREFVDRRSNFQKVHKLPVLR